MSQRAASNHGAGAEYQLCLLPFCHDLPADVDKISVEGEQIGDKVVKVSFIEYVGRRKKVTKIEVKDSELDEMIKKGDGPLTFQLNMF